MIVKVCGITSYEDAALALDAGAEALGFNFWPRSARYVSPEAAGAIVRRLPAEVMTVGLFVNEPHPQTVLAHCAVAGVRYVQFHGSEGPDYCRALDGIPVIKAFGTGPGFDVRVLGDYAVHAFLLDAFDPQRVGGTGQVCDWSVAQAAKAYGPLFLAGGLDENNVAQAIRIVRPYAVDVCSGVEAAPGRKDPARVRRFMHAVARACAPRPGG